MLLVVDVGNTSTAVGVFEGERLRATWRVTSDTSRTADEYGVTLLHLLGVEQLTAASISGAAIASVVPRLESLFEEVCRRFFRVTPLIVGVGTRTGLRILYDNPREVGADRVVDAVAAIRLYGAPLIVADFGTATVLDAISREGDYIGGAIAPGIGISAEALFQRAAKLYPVELERPKAVIGRNTVTAMQSGIIYGYVGLIEGLVARFRKELGEETKVIGTGGWASLIAQETTVIDVVNPSLTLIGLRMLYELNQGT